MSNINTTQLLNDVLARIQDDSPEMRTKMLHWLNNVFLKLSTITTWPFLTKSVTLPIVDNACTLPEDFEDIIYAKQEGNWFFDGNDYLSDRRVYELGEQAASVTLAKPIGYIIEDDLLKFYPNASGDVVLKYQYEIPTYLDNTDDTVYPKNFTNILERACLDFYYEYDLDERAASSLVFDAQELGLLFRWSNHKKGFPKRHSRGYIRERYS